MEMTPQEVENKTGMGRQKKRHSFITLFAITFLVVIAYFAGVERGKTEGDAARGFSLPSSTLFSSSEKNAEHPDMSIFWKTWDLLHERFVDREKLDGTALFYGAIKGMLAATDDPYTTFFDPEENTLFDEELAGSFEGIGAEVGMKDKMLTIIAPLEDMPAERAGLRSGDKVVKINDESTEGMNVDVAVKKMRGKKGTEVKLTIFRQGEQETRDFIVVRDTITVKSVKLDWKDGEILILKINQFGDETANEVKRAVDTLRARPPRGVVIDLRNNSGGRLDATVDIGSFFLSKGKTVAIEEDGKGNRELLRTYDVKNGELLRTVPIVVLINEGSASAAEILAAALRENRDDVTLLGKKSFGKGSVQELVKVTKDTSLKVTVARWLTPNGHQINKEGIAPDIEVDRTDEDYDADRDPQLDRALEVMREKVK
jgi:carboxyl-terminal processing protease